MTKSSPNSFLAKPLALTFGLVLFIFFNGFAQDRERVDREEKVQEYQNNFDIMEGQPAEINSEQVTKSSSLENLSKTPSPKAKKENQVFRSEGEKDSKKDGISTLSFNLFLYIVDKFKED